MVSYTNDYEEQCCAHRGARCRRRHRQRPVSRRAAGRRPHRRVVREALAGYKDALKSARPAAPEPTRSRPPVAMAPGGTARDEAGRERRAGARAEPRHPGRRGSSRSRCDLQVAGFRNTYRPVAHLAPSASATECRRRPATLERRHHRVNNGTTHLQLRRRPAATVGRRLVHRRLEQLARDVHRTSCSNFNPSYTRSSTRAYTQPLLRGFRDRQHPAAAADHR